MQDRAIHEELNIRNTVNTFIATQPLKPEDIHKRREFLPAKDVRWSHGQFSNIVATAAQNGRIALYDVSTLGSSRVELAWLYQHSGQVNKLDFDPHSGYMLLSGSQDKYCKIWDIRDARNPRGYNQYHVKAPVRDVRWSPTNAFDFALCTEAGVIQLWDVRKPNQYLASINAHSKSCYTIAWHPDGRHLASGGVDKILRIWDMKSELKGQKHALQLRCPHGIMNLAWRPPAWSAEFAKRGTWQTCQIATSYTDDDPRTHVWDLRRPLLPFRELSHYETRPMDLLWASKDLLWTVGGAGMFVQSDMSYARQVEDSLPPGAVEWCLDGSFYAVVENRTAKRQQSSNEPSAIFLNVPQDKLSGAEEGTASRSLTDDEGTDMSFAEHSRRQSRTTTTRTKSHPNTPPAQDNQQKVLPLDRTIVGKKELFINGQVGALSRIPGVHLPVPLIEFLANNYARAMTAKERADRPNEILPRLESAFIHNAKVCQAAEMVDVAANWRLMAEIVVPELKCWADNNRKRRLLQEESKTREEPRKNKDQDMLSPLPKMTPQGRDGRSPAASEKVISNMFRGVVESHRASSDSGTHGSSNMTTPRQQPLPTSPAPSKKDSSMWFTLDDAIEPIQPLPPSLANAHSTAALASRVLLDNNSEPSNSPMSSPEKSRQSPEKSRGHRRSATESATMKLASTTTKDLPRETGNPPPADRAQRLFMNRNQEDRRAALRDYKASSRQPFSLEAATTSAQYGREVRHDSSESFPMFSASGGSSARARSFGRSFDTSDVPETSYRSGQGSDDWFHKGGCSHHAAQSEDDYETTPNEEAQDNPGSQAADFAVDESPSLPFSLDGASESRPVPASNVVTQKFKEVLARSPRQKEEVTEQRHDLKTDNKTPPVSEGTVDTTSEVRHGFFARNYRLNNPLLQASEGIEKLVRVSEQDVSMKSDYHASDFRPIDITKYEPSATCFAVSAYPVICEAIQFDANQGSACAQFSAHLLSHVQPFLFHQSLRKPPSPDDLWTLPATLADRLLSPVCSARIVENIFATHIEYLRNLNLYIPAAELRKLCIEDFDYPHLAGPEARTGSGSVGDQLKIDPLKLKSTCSNCRNLLPADAIVCKNCNHPVEGCSICDLPLTAGAPDVSTSSRCSQSTGSTRSTITVYCHVCGHSSHLSCMSTWLSLEDTHGECPTPDCGCDCGPGLLRDQRIARQVEANENAANNRGSIATSIKRDSKVVGQIPAVDKARDTLRKRPSESFGSGMSAAGEKNSDKEEKYTPSSSGTAGSTSVWSKKGTSAGIGRGATPGIGRSNSGGVGSASVGATGGTSFGRRVRVVEPDR